MSIHISPNLPANVVEIGNEITQAKLDAINNGYAPTSGNPFVTVSYLTTNLYLTDAPSDGSQYARKNGAWAVVSGGSGSATWGGITGTLSAQTDLNTALGLKSPLASPAFTGTPTAPTASTGDNSTTIANTAFVQNTLAGATVASTTAVLATVRNQTGSTITKGSVVYINGAGGNKATVALAKANAESTSSNTYGVVQTDIANNNNGTVVISGIISNIDTSAFTAGTMLYLSPTTAGAYTTTKPSAPNHLVYVGVVAYQHATQGTIQLKIQNGYELEEIHNVQISSPSNNEVLVYNSSAGLWYNNSIAGILSYTPVPEAPINGTKYLRQNANWTAYDGISDAPSDGSSYVRYNGTWLDIAGLGYQTASNVSSYVTGLGYQTASDVSTYVTGLGYQTASDVSTALGSYLPLAGGSMTSGASITLADSTYDSYVGYDGFGVELTADNTQQAFIGYNTIYVKNAGTGVTLNTTGITFPDSTVQTTAYTGGLPTAQKIKVNMYASSVSLDGSNIRVYAGPNDIVTTFTSTAKWFGAVYMGTIFPVSSITFNTDSASRPYAFLTPLGGIDAGTSLHYTEDGGTTWTPADLPIY